jgi:hypothetical protein
LKKIRIDRIKDSGSLTEPNRTCCKNELCGKTHSFNRQLPEANLKSLIVLTGLFVFAAQSQAALTCTEVNAEKIGMELTVQADELNKGKNQTLVLTNVRVEASTRGDTVVGERSVIKSDSAYKPRKYKGHSRFDLSELEITESNTYDKVGEAFEPFDQCSFQLLMPNDFAVEEGFYAHVIMSCDQSGASMTLDCQLD